MITQPNQAQDEICSLINNAWKLAVKDILNYCEKDMRWYGVKVKGAPDIPSQEKIWCQTRLIGIAERQASLCNNVGFPGGRRYKITGKIKIEIFIPINESLKRTAGVLRQNLKTAIRGKQTAGGVLFRNTEVVDSGKVNGWDCCAIWSDYEYYEIG